MKRVLLVVLAAALGFAGTAQAAGPADARGPRISGLFAATVGGDETNATVAGSFGYKFDRYLALEAEITDIPDLDSLSKEFRAAGFTVAKGRVVAPILLPVETGGRAVFFTMNFRAEVPTGLDWLIPYFAGGGGIASIRQTIRVTPLASERNSLPELRRSMPAIRGFPVISLLEPRAVRHTETDLTLNVGGGVSFHIVKGLWYDVDLRYFRVLSDSDLNLGRFGTGVSYRF